MFIPGTELSYLFFYIENKDPGPKKDPGPGPEKILDPGPEYSGNLLWDQPSARQKRRRNGNGAATAQRQLRWRNCAPALRTHMPEALKSGP